MLVEDAKYFWISNGEPFEVKVYALLFFAKSGKIVETKKIYKLRGTRIIDANKRRASFPGNRSVNNSENP